MLLTLKLESNHVQISNTEARESALWISSFSGKFGFAVGNLVSVSHQNTIDGKAKITSRQGFWLATSIWEQ